MAALEAADAYLDGYLVGCHGLGGVGLSGHNVHAAGGTDNKLALGLIVEVEQDVALQGAGLEIVDAIHAGLLVNGEDGLQRAVLEGLVLKDGHSGGYAHAVVGAEGGALSLHPVAVDVCLDGVGQEVVGGILSLLGHHVHVTLQGNHGAVLHAGSGRHAHDDVAGIVLKGLEAVALCPLQEKGLNLFKVSAGTRHLGQGVESFPDALRL